MQLTYFSPRIIKKIVSTNQLRGNILQLVNEATSVHKSRLKTNS